MKREIKFRVYDSISKKMHLWHEIKNIALPEFDLEHYTVMQFTGIKDENGKDIYEGDFCKHLGEHGMISFSDGCFWLYLFDEPAKEHLSHYKKYDKENSDLQITGLRSFN